MPQQGLMVPVLCAEGGFDVLDNHLLQRRQVILPHPSSLCPSLSASRCSQQVFRRDLLSQKHHPRHTVFYLIWIRFLSAFLFPLLTHRRVIPPQGRVRMYSK